MYKILLIIVMVLFSLNAEAKLFAAEDFTLNNGLKVIVVPNHKAPIVRQMVWYKVGAADENLGEGGTAHLLEHLMFRGTKNIKDADFNKIITDNGGENNAFTSQDYTAYYETTDISKLELAMFMEADRMVNLNISKEDFAKERDIVYQERKQMIETSPSSYFAETFQRNLWQEHPYSRPITGMPDEIMNLTYEGVNNFYKNYYAPNNAILVLSGDIDVKTAKVLAEKYYGKIKPSKNLKNTEFPKTDKKIRTTFEMELPQINATRWNKAYIVPSYNTDKSKIYTLSVLAKYLGDGDTSKLYKKMVLDKKVALGISASYSEDARSYSSFNISAFPKENISMSEFEEAFQQAINEAVNEISPDEIENTKNKMLAGLVYLRDNPNEAAYIVGNMAVVGFSVDEIENYADEIRKVDYKDVSAEALNLLNNNSALTGVLKSVEEK